ncbi:MAG: DUF4474 domain-containing protein, partial [Spirochaetaceae bacterium]
ETNPEQKNLRGQVVRHYDTGGLLLTPSFDFKGQSISVTRKLFKKYKEVADWTDANLATDLEGEDCILITETDALGRITRQVAPDGSIITPEYNEAGLLTAETVTHVDPAVTTRYIKNIDYNEKGQRNKIVYGNDVSTVFSYDRETFRLKRLETKRNNNDPLQDWYYTYDPVGNITHVEDKNIPAAFFDNQKVTGLSTYTYDALYRLVEAAGRENDAALGFGDCDNWNDAGFIHSVKPGDPLSIRTYTQIYRYDGVGNIRMMKHSAGPAGSWTRMYEYETDNNRLKSTRVGDINHPVDYTKYKHHAKHGFLEELPHLEKIAWNFKEEVVLTSRQHCAADNIPVITYYQYDGQGQRIRKITEDQAQAGNSPVKKEERVYIAGYELYIKHSGTDAGLRRTSLSLMDKEHQFVMIETRNDVDDGTEKHLVRYQLHNHLGSACLELDNDAHANVISYEEYHPYGTTAYQASNATIKSVAKRYRYTGKERDEETGLEYHGARYYLPWLGRWLSADPKGLADGINIYCYVNMNPVIKTDRKGMSSEDQYAPLFSKEGEEAAQYWADTVVEGERQGGIGGMYKVATGWMFGFFASLWTPRTASLTGTVINTAAGGIPAGLVTFLAGAYSYDPVDETFYAQMYSPQRNFGYYDLYDKYCVFITFFIHSEPIRFEAKGREWKIELWKGMYGPILTGGEVGIYVGKDYGPASLLLGKVEGGNDTSCAEDEEMLPMSIKLYDKESGQLIFERSKERHWWLTGFDFFEFKKASELVMEVSIEMEDEEMRKSFISALEALGYGYKVENSSVVLTFDQPHTRQPWEDQDEFELRKQQMIESGEWRQYR